MTVELTDAPLDIAGAHDAVRHREAGGIGLFSGVVRDHHEGEAVVSLTYEAWADEARRSMRAVADAVVAAFPGVRCVYVGHRTGSLAVGEVSVVCAASAPHRDEALAAATALIDRVKASVPIWKHEFLADGRDRWPGSDLR
ncbi:MAG: molybdenum cofactor biosynthesis protein MoaE [Actinobacteria bacterium]|nr:molybdenum cofactor biosynthesis protein MoaE [Actinomycetota bacterium]